ncbi:hypothetical protein RUM43_004906 [Polyplax serrata]|uniref:Uncharacterized protein n=1 Tax=Polyplax serrata TaxID=468196 RepID=A0AAN8SC85_POLSC
MNEPENTKLDKRTKRGDGCHREEETEVAQWEKLGRRGENSNQNSFIQIKTKNELPLLSFGGVSTTPNFYSEHFRTETTRRKKEKAPESKGEVKEMKIFFPHKNG